MRPLLISNHAVLELLAQPPGAAEVASISIGGQPELGVVRRALLHQRSHLLNAISSYRVYAELVASPVESLSTRVESMHAFGHVHAWHRM